MSQWPMVKLGDVGTISTGNTPSKSDDQYFIDGSIPFIKPNNFDVETISFLNTSDEYLNVNGLAKSRFVEAGAVLVTCIGTIGKVGISKHKVCFNQQINAIVPNTSKLEPKFLAYAIISRRRELSAIANAAVVPIINKTQFSNFEIPLPPIPEQQRIVEQLDQAGELIDQRKEQLKLMEDLIQSTFYDMFGDPVKNEKGWEVKNIDSLVTSEKGSIKRGPFGGALKKEIFVENGYLVYEQYHALNNDFSFARYYIDEKTFQELKGFEVKPKDLIISCSGVNLGRLAEIPEGATKGIINQALLKITLNNKVILNTFFIKVFTCESFKEKYFGDQRGSGVPNFPPISDFKMFKFICPPLDLQTAFADRVQQIESLKSQMSASLVELEHNFNALMQQSFGG